MTTWHVENTGYDFSISQFESWTQDGAPPEDAQFQCWAAAATGIVKRRTGVLVSPDAAKDYAIGQGTVRQGNTANIQAILTHWNVPSLVQTPVGAQSLLKDEYDVLMKGHAAIVDRHLHIPTSTALHWETVVGQYGHDYTVDYVVLHDPETGTRVVESVETHIAMAYAIAPNEFLLVTEQ